MHEKVGGQTTLIDPTLEKVGGQLTPLTPCFRGLWCGPALHPRFQLLSRALCNRGRYSVLFSADLLSLIERHGFIPHLYADDTQILGSSLHIRIC